MSECVVRMEMPKGCEDCPFRDMLLCCCAKGRKYAGSSPVRPDWCPILCQLPEGHGWLIDERNIFIPYDVCDGHEAMGFVEETPTIVPAEAERSET